MIVVLSDNGAEGNDRMQLLDNATWVPANFDLSYGNLGKVNSYSFPGPGWGQVSSAPLRLFKAYLTEGGLRVPMVVVHDKIKSDASYNTQVARIQDLAPTFLDLAQIDPPGPNYEGRPVRTMTGRSLLPMLTGREKSVYGPEDTLGWELFGHRAVRKGDWKLLWADGKNGSNTWQLYNIEEDPREIVDMAALQPERLQNMTTLWEEYSRNNNVILPIGDIGNPN